MAIVPSRFIRGNVWHTKATSIEARFCMALPRWVGRFLSVESVRIGYDCSSYVGIRFWG